MELDGAAVLDSPDPARAFRHMLASRGEYGDGDVEALVASREAIARSKEPVHYERQLVSGKWIECRGTPIAGGGYLAIYRDIQKQREMQDRLERLATCDDLTGLANRRQFLAALEREMERVRRYQRSLCVAIVDVDHFKSVNDGHGHAAGDQVLRALADVLAATVRDVDAVGRLGGEEFGLMLPESDLSSAVKVAERVRQAVAAMTLDVEGESLGVTVSVGLAQTTPDCDMKGLLARADAALYTAKRNGRNRVIAQSGHDQPLSTLTR
jgi:diguanylate cyclase (GGDEF)-like protein